MIELHVWEISDDIDINEVIDSLPNVDFEVVYRGRPTHPVYEYFLFGDSYGVKSGITGFLQFPTSVWLFGDRRTIRTMNDKS